ncbi:MAG: ferredoxin [Candidatus Nanopelagicales bacterium]
MSTVSIDWRRCRGHGVCSAALRELITLDEWGYPVVADPEVPEALHNAARMASATCPAAALRLR